MPSHCGHLWLRGRRPVWSPPPPPSRSCLTPGRECERDRQALKFWKFLFPWLLSWIANLLSVISVPHTLIKWTQCTKSSKRDSSSIKENCINLLTLMSLQTRINFFLLWNTKQGELHEYPAGRIHYHVVLHDSF